MKKAIIIFLTMLLFACMSSGPQKTLDEMADALATNNGKAFLAHLDMRAFAANYIKNMTRSDEALSSLNTFGQMLGLGNLDNLIGNIIDMQARLSTQYERDITSGALVAQCGQSDTPDCPWVPAALKSAHIVKINENAAIARIATSAKSTCWLALRKEGDKWLVVGLAGAEAIAREYATQPGPKDA